MITFFYDFFKSFPFLAFLCYDFDPMIKQIKSKIGFKLGLNKYLIDKYYAFLLAASCIQSRTISYSLF